RDPRAAGCGGEAPVVALRRSPRERRPYRRVERLEAVALQRLLQRVRPGCRRRPTDVIRGCGTLAKQLVQLPGSMDKHGFLNEVAGICALAFDSKVSSVF